MKVGKELFNEKERCFHKSLDDKDLKEIRELLSSQNSNSLGFNFEEFLELHLLFAKQGRQETIWTILRAFEYTDSLTLKQSYLHPK